MALAKYWEDNMEILTERLVMKALREKEYPAPAQSTSALPLFQVETFVPPVVVMEYQDKTLTCKDCLESFQFTANDQQTYAKKDWAAPIRCKACRQANKAMRKIKNQQHYAGLMRSHW